MQGVIISYGHSHTFRVCGGDRGQGTGVARLQRPAAASSETLLWHVFFSPYLNLFRKHKRCRCAPVGQGVGRFVTLQRHQTLRLQMRTPGTTHVRSHMGTTLCLAPWGQPVVAATDDIRTNGLTCLVGTCSSAKPRKGGQFFILFACCIYRRARGYIFFRAFGLLRLPRSVFDT